MRDALSVLDQCLSFGEGAVTAARVREVLGLVADEAYAELLELVAARNPAGVFPLLDRLADSRAPTWSSSWVGPRKRFVRCSSPMLQVGAEPEGLTEAMRHALTAVRDRLPAGDLLRMLKLFAEIEAVTRSERNSSPRRGDAAAALGVDGPDGGSGGGAQRRTGRSSGQGDRGGRVEQGGQGGRRSSPAERRRSAIGPLPELRRRPVRTGPQPSVGRPSRPPRRPLSAEFTLAGLTDAWPRPRGSRREQSRFLGEALAAAHDHRGGSAGGLR